MESVASAENVKRKSEADTGILRPISSTLISFLLLCSFVGGTNAATYTTNVYTSTPSYQKDLIAGVTTQFSATVIASPYFPNTQNVTLAIENAPVVCSTITQSSCDLDADVKLMVQNSTYTYLYGYANGMTDQVYNEISAMNGFFNLCNSTSTWLQVGSTSTYDTHLSTTACSEVLGTVSYAVYELLTGTYAPKGF